MIRRLITSHQKSVRPGAILLGCALFTFYSYQFIQVKETRHKLSSLQQSAQRLAYLQTNYFQPASLSTPLKAVIEKTAQQHQVTLSAVEQDDNGAKVTLAPLPFKQLIAWLAHLRRTDDIQIRTLKLRSLPQSDKVQIEILHLQRPLPKFLWKLYANPS